MTTLSSSPRVQSAPPLLEAEPRAERPLLAFCPLCASKRLHYVFSHQGYRVVRCADCRLMLLNPQPGERELAAIYSATYFLGDETPEARQRVAEMKAATARRYLDDIARYRGKHGGRLLEVGCGHGDLLVEAQRLGYDVTGVEIAPAAAQQATARLGGRRRIICGEVESLAGAHAHFDVCVLSDVIEHTRDPLAFLQTIHRLLRPGGTLFIATPSLDSWSARLLRQRWMDFKPEHLFYFDSNTIQHALFGSGFRQIVVRPGWKILNLDYVAQHFVRFPVPVLTPLVRSLAGLLPAPLRRWNLPVVASGMAAFAQAVEPARQPLLSVVMAAYNEAATFETVMEALLRKQIPGLDIELVVVESNSTDGTRELALRYQHHPRVRLILEDQPRGKGRAVRAGLEQARGDFVLIQDADLEYDLEDYDTLLEPLLQGREAFVLGSRHGGSAWKMRHFVDQQLLSTTLNAGHWFFTMLLNLLFGQRLKDPFTMYKVFRRDCLVGLSFECDRFDFDHELVAKLVRKGYTPVEIPVNYRSRSFQEGKKVRFFRDPLTWLRALARARVARIDPLRELEQRRARPEEAR
jgi:SAM-dependent methyltransferase